MTAYRRWDEDDHRYVYPLLDENGNVTGWTRIPPTRRSPDYNEVKDEHHDLEANADPAGVACRVGGGRVLGVPNDNKG